MANEIDLAQAAGAHAPTPWAQPPLRKLAEKIHDSATAMHVLGQLVVAHGDLLDEHKSLLVEAIAATRESTEAMRELTRTLKETLG